MAAGQFCATSLRYDLHSHLLPAVDDGVRDWDDALKSVGILEQIGYQGAVTTPHIYPDLFNNKEADLRIQFSELCARVRLRYPNFSLALGAEYYFDDRLIDRIHSNPSNLLTFGTGQKFILIEFPRGYLPSDISGLLSTCKTHKLQPIIAHVERYEYVQTDKAHLLLKTWMEEGAFIQMDLGAVAGQFGPEAEKTAMNILKMGGYHFIGTDMHTPHQGSRYYDLAWQRLEKSRHYFDETWHHQLIDSPRKTFDSKCP